MNTRSTAARLPPRDLPGLDPAWSRLVTAPDVTGVERTWHVLDTGAKSGGGTVLCVHGNPNWSYMWRGLAGSLTDWRVVAVDALNMGFSDRTGGQRRLADHIADLDAVTKALELDGPVVTVAHDWGGPISMGWAQRNVDRLAGIVLMNTGVALPEGMKMPPLIALARATLRATTETTPLFVHSAFRMARPQLDRQVYSSYTAPYRSADRRTGIRDFVDDIPIAEADPSFATLAQVARGLDDLRHLPALLLWGAKDPVFSDGFLHDLIWRLPQASVQRYPNAGHQIIEDTEAVDDITTWIGALSNTHDQIAGTNQIDVAPIWSAIEARSADDGQAIVEMHAKDTRQVERSISFRELDQQVRAMASALAGAGVSKGDRLATLIPPGIDLTVLVYACLRAGIIIVPPDAALGVAGMRRALRSSRPDFLVSDWRGLTLAKALRLPATRLSLDDLTSQSPVPTEIASEMALEPSPGEVAAVAFTSGSTGPSKGVVYTQGQLGAQRDAIRQAFDIRPDDRLVVAFAPFAVLAPALGISSVVPPMDVTKPAALTAPTLADAAAAIDATIVFASPAVLANIATTAANLDQAHRRAFDSVRTMVTAGAPVSPQLLAAVQPVFPNAQFFTPYGMTELLPVTAASAADITAGGIDSGESDTGVCVGQPLAGIDLAIRLVGAPSGTLPAAVEQGTLGEVWVRAAHASLTYDNLWRQTNHAFVDGWHRTGDVGHLDAQGRVWIEGRVDHLIHTDQSTLAPVGIELQAQSVAGVDLAAAVGVGPVGTQQLAVVITGESLGSAKVASAHVTAAIRRAVDPDVAAVLVAPRIPVDRRHNSKIDRTRVQRWADAVLRGARPPRL